MRQIAVFVFLGDTNETLAGWEVNIFEGDACLGTPFASGVTHETFGGIQAFSSPPVPPGPYSVSQKPRSGWLNTTPLCQDIIVADFSDPTFLNAVAFRNVPVANGDVNSDEATNSLDSLIVLQVDAGLVPLEDLDLFGQFRADVNLDFAIKAIDAQLILQFDAAFIDSLPVGGD